jgi:hypothetical protein
MSAPAPGAAAAPRPGPLAAAVARFGFPLVFAAWTALRIVAALRREFDSDEPQHLHVVWGWTHGLLPYRDLFDNHAPLFHAAMAPLLALAGERAGALVLMRLAMLPWHALVLVAVYRLGRALFSPRVGRWGAVFAALWPEHFLTALEFRPDVPWAALWLLGLAVLLDARAERGRAWAAGVLFGLALAVSLKTLPLLGTLALAAAALRLIAPPAVSRRDGRLSALVLGTLLPPLAVAAWFAGRHALGALARCTLAHHLTPGLGGNPWPRAAWLLPALVIAIPIARWLALHTSDPGRGERQARLFLASALGFAAFAWLWPIPTPQDFLPLEPVAALFVAALVIAWRPRATPGAGAAWAPAARVRTVALVLIAVAELAALAPRLPWRDGTRPALAVIEAALRLTRPDETVMDLKGEMVFRPRAFYPVLETVTRRQIAAGLVADRIPERLVETRTAVVVADSRFLPPRARAYMDSCFVSVGPVRVAGRDLGDLAPGATVAFHLSLPDRYQVVSDRGPGTGLLDGLPAAGPRPLAAGAHRYRPGPGERRAVVVWARAVERGYAPGFMNVSPAP